MIWIIHLSLLIKWTNLKEAQLQANQCSRDCNCEILRDTGGGGGETVNREEQLSEGHVWVERRGDDEREGGIESEC